MPAVAAAAIAAGATIYGAKKQSDAAKYASFLQNQSNSEAMAQRDRERQQEHDEFERQMELERQKHDAEQQLLQQRQMRRDAVLRRLGWTVPGYGATGTPLPPQQQSQTSRMTLGSMFGDGMGTSSVPSGSIAPPLTSPRLSLRDFDAWSRSPVRMG